MVSLCLITTGEQTDDQATLTITASALVNFFFCQVLHKYVEAGIIVFSVQNANKHQPLFKGSEG